MTDAHDCGRLFCLVASIHLEILRVTAIANRLDWNAEAENLVFLTAASCRCVSSYTSAAGLYP